MTTPSPVDARLRAAHAQHLPNRSGQVADYIPELAVVEPDQFGIAIAMVDGQVYEVGDSRAPFTIQSVSKAFSFGLALRDHGPDRLLERVGVEPTGDPFNSIVLDESGNRPQNPMVNAGAIAVTSLVNGRDISHRWERIARNLSAFAGRTLSENAAVARSESLTGHRNRAIAHLMRASDMIRPEVDEVLDLYFRQCAVEVTAVDLAVMGATLAAAGRQPITGEEVLTRDETAAVLSVMSSCGMYDSSGEWIYRVGLPAKSGVGGGIVAVLPGQAAIGVFSPRLDAKGNSVRGLAVCEQLSRDLGLHVFGGRSQAPALRAAYGRHEVTSRYRRLGDEEQAIRDHGAAVQIVELQGTLDFAAMELLARHVTALLDHDGGPADPRVRVDELLVDFRRVPACTPEATELLVDLAERCRQHDVGVNFVSVPDGELSTLRLLAASWSDGSTVEFHHDLETALEEAEDRMLHRLGLDRQVDGIDIASAAICAGLDPDDLAVLMTVTRERCFGRGETLARPGDPTASAWIVLGGVITVSTADGPPGRPGRRLRSLGPGSILGEMALLSGTPRSAWVQAETPVRVRELSADGLTSFTDLRPGGALRLLRNICGILGGWLRDETTPPSGSVLTAGTATADGAHPSRDARRC